MFKKDLHIILLLLVLLGCQTKTDISVPSASPVLVMNAQWQQGQTFILRLTKSRGVLDSRDSANILNAYTVKKALITVKENNIVVDTLVYDSVNYRYITSKSRKTIIGNTYEIIASAAGFVDVNTSSIQPALVKSSSVKFVRNAQTNASGIMQDQITVTFTDDGTKTNYYLFRIHKSDGSYTSCVNTPDTDVEYLVNGDPFSADKCLDGNKLLFSDKNFNGKTKTIVFYVPHDDMNSVLMPGNITRRPWVDLVHINEQYFNYIKSANNYEIAQDNPFAEPANLLSNVKNGYGFFTCFTFSADTLK